LTDPLPALLDAKGLMAELGVTRAVAEKLMRRLPVVVFKDVRKVYVRRGDVAKLVEERTFTKDQVAAGHNGAGTDAGGLGGNPG
jgi:hypothetical protein